MRYSWVVVSKTAPTAFMYVASTSGYTMSGVRNPRSAKRADEWVPVASRTSVVPVSNIPGALFKSFVDAPYLTDWEIPKNCDAGLVDVIDLQCNRWR